jgi:AraC family transcriptional regulator, transcriptional activator of pobA
MKGKIPIWQLKENISGVRIERFNDAFISSLINEITQLHRNDHFVTLILTSGSAELLVDFKKVIVAKDTLVFLIPGQIQKAVKFSNNSKGWIMFLDNKLVDDQSRMMIEDSLHKGPLLSPSPSDLAWYSQYFELLFQTYHDNSLGSLHKPAVNALAGPCIYKIASAFQANSDKLTGEHSQRSIELTKKFKRLVRKHYRELKKPSDYAEMLNFSISYLNDTIKSVTGFTTTYFIQQEMLREGQRLLGYTDSSIKEIASHLGFDDPKYFNRIFSKLVGVSPGRFRNIFKSKS